MGAPTNIDTTNDPSGCENHSDLPAPVYVKATVSVTGCMLDVDAPPRSACPIDDAPPCGMDGVCMPADACVLVQPADPCPAGFMDAQMQEGGTCGCVCGAACPDEVRLFTDNGCMNGVVTVAADGTCHEAANLAEARGTRGPDAAGLTCTASTTPSGNTRKLCCPN